MTRSLSPSPAAVALYGLLRQLRAEQIDRAEMTRRLANAQRRLRELQARKPDVVELLRLEAENRMLRELACLQADELFEIRAAAAA